MVVIDSWYARVRRRVGLRSDLEMSLRTVATQRNAMRPVSQPKPQKPKNNSKGQQEQEEQGRSSLPEAWDPLAAWHAHPPHNHSPLYGTRPRLFSRATANAAVLFLSLLLVKEAPETDSARSRGAPSRERKARWRQPKQGGRAPAVFAGSGMQSEQAFTCGQICCCCLGFYERASVVLNDSF